MSLCNPPVIILLGLLFRPEHHSLSSARSPTSNCRNSDSFISTDSSNPLWDAARIYESNCLGT